MLSAMPSWLTCRIRSSLDDTNLNDQDFEQPGGLSAVVAKVLMKLLLQSVTLLAREVSRWTRACGENMFRLFCYIN